ncbi:MAG TPA: hypothetical protein VLI54_04085 [Bacillota bacterium]|nr:hypothetical protein [Bacillota bacterium]
MARRMSGEFAATWLRRGLDWIGEDGGGSYSAVSMMGSSAGRMTLGFLVARHSPEDMTAELAAIATVDRAVGHFAERKNFLSGDHHKAHGVDFYGNHAPVGDGLMVRAASTISSVSVTESPDRMPDAVALAGGYRVAGYVGSLRGVLSQCAVVFRAEGPSGRVWSDTGNLQDVDVIRGGLTDIEERLVANDTGSFWRIHGQIVGSGVMADICLSNYRPDNF